MTYRIWVQSTASGGESVYGDCKSWDEVKAEINGHIRFCGLYYRVERIES